MSKVTPLKNQSQFYFNMVNCMFIHTVGLRQDEIPPRNTSMHSYESTHVCFIICSEKTKRFNIRHYRRAF